MQYLFLTVIALAVAAFAPLKVTASLVLCLAVTILAVKVTGTKILGSISMADAARAVAWSAALLALAIAVVLWMSGGNVQLEGIAAVGLLAGLFVSFVFGFKLALNAHFGASSLIAVISTVVSAVCLFALRPLLF